MCQLWLFSIFCLKRIPLFRWLLWFMNENFRNAANNFLEVIKEKIPRLERKSVPIITDREAGIVNAFEKILPNSRLLICWNHILRDLKFWLSKHCATQKDFQFYYSFAIAHLTEFCIKGVMNPNVGFDTKKMRTHLQYCLESGNLSCFPTVPRRPNIKNRNRTKHKSIPKNLHCKCRLPDFVGDLVKCAPCKTCFHKYCVRASIDLSCPTNKFVCEKCLE